MWFGAVFNTSHAHYESVLDVLRQSLVFEIEHKEGEEQFVRVTMNDADTSLTVSQDADVVFSAISAIDTPHDLQVALLEKDQKEGSVEVLPLIELAQTTGVITEFFPLHEPDSSRKSIKKKVFRSFLTFPIEDVRNYFGEEVGLYVAFMEFTTRAFFFPAIIGTWLWFFRPKGITVDNSPYIPFFSLFCAIWTTLVVILWHRKSVSLAYQWGTDNALPSIPPLRAKYRGSFRKSPITGEMERWYSPLRRRMWQLFSVVITLGMLLIALTAMLLSMNLQGYMVNKESPFYVEALSQYAAPGAIFDPNDEKAYYWLIPVITHSVFIFILNSIYRVIAEHLTELENYRTEEQHKNALITKRFLFEFLDCFSPLFYIAIYRQDIRLLRLELIALYTSDEIRRIATESLLPWVLQSLTLWWQGRSDKQAKKHDKRVAGEVERQSKMDEYEMFDDYLEMVIQMGYVSLFASAFPLAAILSIFSNFVEIRSDTFKLVHVTRRPMPTGVANIGFWGTCLDLLCYLTIPSNVFLFAFSSDQMATWFPSLFNAQGDMKVGYGRYVLGMSVGLEHLLLLVVIVLRHIIPRVPSHVRMARYKAIFKTSKKLQ